MACVLTACLLTACLLTACSDGDDRLDKQSSAKDAADVVQSAVFEGEWTVNKQVVDTARLEVSNVLKVRLPVEYLLTLFCPAYVELSTQSKHYFEFEGQPVVIPYLSQGYTNDATFNHLVPTSKDGSDGRDSANGMTSLVTNAYFTVAIDGVAYRIDLLSEQAGTALYKNDTGLWTIGIPISYFYVTNTETNEGSLRQLPTPITIYYNSKKRIG